LSNIDPRVCPLHDEPGPGSPRTITDERVEAVIVKTLESTPAGATHWSTRNMARATGVSVLSVQRIWRAFGLQPHHSIAAGAAARVRIRCLVQINARGTERCGINFLGRHQRPWRPAEKLQWR
jgi:hypothetical protein